MQSSPVSLHFSLLGANIVLSTLSLCSYIGVWDQVSQQYKTRDKIVVSYILIFKCLDWSEW
jgi:hypothetical protein